HARQNMYRSLVNFIIFRSGVDTLYLVFFLLLLRPPPRFTLFPYTTLFRSSPSWLAPRSQGSGPTCRSSPCSGPASWCTSPGTHRSEEHTSELQSRGHLVCRLLLEKKK